MIPKTVPEICDYFDCTVIQDCVEVKGECIGVYLIGDWGDWSVGIPAVFLTPGHRTMAELEAYCASDKGREEINKEADKTWLDWNMEQQDFNDNLREETPHA